MKVRSGFVSNSSSSSFLIYGAWVDVSKVKDMLKSKLSEEDLKELEEDPYMLGEFADSLPMYYHFDYESDACAFGRSFSSIKDDETGKGFKDSVKEKLREMFGEDVKCDTIRHEYYC